VMHNFATASTQAVTPVGPSSDGIIITNSCPGFCFGKRVKCRRMSVVPLPKDADPQGTVRVNPVASALHATTGHRSSGANRQQLTRVFRMSRDSSVLILRLPGMHLLASSVLSGSANAFLTLRVGMITKEYCRCTVRVEKTGLRRAATLKAAKLLGSIVREGTVKLSKATVNASKMKLSQAFRVVTGRRSKVEAS
jgi:hypothetical protein